MIISVINHTNGALSDAEANRGIRALNRQIAEDFAPHWGLSATMRLEGSAFAQSAAMPSLERQLMDMRGDAVIYLWHPTDVQSAIGYHSRNFLGVPYGFVFLEASRRLHESWTVSLSHEALEMIADPKVNLLVMGPHPANARQTVFHWYEICDAVQTETYQIDGLDVSNFVLPLYFTDSEEPGSRNDFLNRAHDRGPLQSFGVNPGGYVGFFNPETNQHEAFGIQRDPVAAARWQIKSQLHLTRRSQRYQYRTAANISPTSALRSLHL